MATRSSLGFIADATTVRLTDGSTNIIGNTITATNLQPSTTLKTDSARNIISANLFLSDIKDYVPPSGGVSNPMTTTLDADNKDIINVGNLETTLINNKVVLYNPSVSNLNMGSFNINAVNNLNMATINSKIPMYNPAVSSLDMKGLYINNEVNITQLQDKTQFISSIPISNWTVLDSDLILNNNNISSVNNITASTINAKTPMYNPAISSIDMKGFNISNLNQLLFTNTASIVASGTDLKLSSSLDYNFNNILNNPQITTLQGQTQYQSTTPLVTSFSGTLQSDTRVNAPTLRIGSGANAYLMPTVKPLTNQYLSGDGTNAVFKIIEQGSYAQIARQINETVGYSFTANVLRTATALGGTTNQAFPNSSDITLNTPNATITYTGFTKVMAIECSMRARVSDAKNANGLVTLYLTINGSTVSVDTTRITGTDSREFLYCKWVQPLATGSIVSFSISYDTTVTNALFISSISLNLNSYALA